MVLYARAYKKKKENKKERKGFPTPLSKRKK